MTGTRSPVSIDLSASLADAVGPAHGMREGEAAGVAAALARGVREILEERKGGSHGFLDLPDDGPLAGGCLDFAAAARGRFDEAVVLGIGGSGLGATMLRDALTTPKGMRLTVLDNVDPDWLASELDRMDLARTLFLVVSKSGTTVETMGQFLHVRERLRGALGKGWTGHVVAITDPEQGVLRSYAAKEGIEAFPIPPAVGGRFSALSAVGLLPAALAGVDVRGLLDGARACREACLDPDVASNPAARLAQVQYVMAERRVKPMTVLMPYSQRLAAFADWYRQLLAESLGKARSVHGAYVHVGVTPVNALGATDQHSQVQLYVEGPWDKWILFLEVGAFDRELPIAAAGTDLPDPKLGYLAGRSFNELIAAELDGTRAALTAASRPHGTVRVDRISSESVGALMVLFEVEIALLGKLWQVNPYDQPGVEAGKRIARERLTP